MDGSIKSLDFINEILDFDNRIEFYRDVEDKLIKFLNIGNKKKTKVLYIGCGKGFIVELLLKNLGQDKIQNLFITCIDLEEELLSAAKSRLSKYSNNIEYLQADANNLPFNNESFDVVLSHTLIKWMEKPDKTINEMKRVLKTGGELFIGERVLPAVGREIDRLDYILKIKNLDSLKKAPNPMIALSLPDLLNKEEFKDIKTTSFSTTLIKDLSNYKKVFVYNILWVKGIK